MYATVCVVYATVGNLVLCLSQEKRKEYDSQHDKMDMEAAMVSYERAANYHRPLCRGRACDCVISFHRKLVN